MQEISDDYYGILGVEEGATSDDIRKAYLKLAKKLHPDRFPNDPEKKAAAQQEFARVTRAHEVLGDSKQREEYDAIRILARKRADLELSTGGMQAPAPGSLGPNPATTGEIKGETKESWAAKHAVRAEDAMKRKKYPDAETAIKEAIRLDPNKAKYRCQLAEIYIARGWKTLAQTEIQAALRLDPTDSEAKQIELKLKASQKAGAGDKKDAGGFLGSLSKLLGKK